MALYLRQTFFFPQAPLVYPRLFFPRLPSHLSWLLHSQTRPHPNPRLSPKKSPDEGSSSPPQSSTDERRLTNLQGLWESYVPNPPQQSFGQLRSQGFEVSYVFSLDIHCILPSTIPDNELHLFHESRLRQEHFCHFIPSWCQAQSIQRIANLTCRQRFRRAHLLRISQWSSLEVIPFESVQFNPDRFGSVLMIFFCNVNNNRTISFFLARFSSRPRPTSHTINLNEIEKVAT